ncbi:hypothetical protein SFK315_1543 [Shigella flexneri K-315]|uniref:Uncharacterized protein n=1 Tax=Shigella flexneri K-315 TaxID=766150 RepID=I6CW46_SHIFL|nr:hypothetical protein SFK315_1543 [Shigella flexneri K-315]
MGHRNAGLGKSLADNAVAVLTELLTCVYPCPPLTPRIPAAAGHPEYAAHCLDDGLRGRLRQRLSG